MATQPPVLSMKQIYVHAFIYLFILIGVMLKSKPENDAFIALIVYVAV